MQKNTFYNENVLRGMKRNFFRRSEFLKKETFCNEELTKVSAKVLAEISRLGDKIPYVAQEGEYEKNVQRKTSWWTNGFWGGINWKLYHYTKNEQFKETAINVEEKLDQSLSEFVQLHHDVGFLWLPTSVLDYMITGSEQSYQRSIHAANILAARFNIKGNFIRAWNNTETSNNSSGLTIIDSMMNVSLLFWCSEVLKDPRFYEIAVSHAETVAKNLVREDGSVNHIGIFDTLTGEFKENAGGQGFSEDSSWSRGQAWALYGFLNCYKHTGNKKFLDISEKIANYVLTQLSLTNYIAKIDYRAPQIPDDFDASASAITLCGLIELSKYVSEYEKAGYEEYIKRILDSLKSIANYDLEKDGIIGKCAVRYFGEENKNVSLVYADYYYIEALLKLIDADIDIW